MTRKELERTMAEALNALLVWSQNGTQLCFRSHNDIPMGMSKKQERLARRALDALTKAAMTPAAGRRA